MRFYAWSSTFRLKLEITLKFSDTNTSDSLHILLDMMNKIKRILHLISLMTANIELYTKALRRIVP